MALDRFSQELSRPWRWLAEGWRYISEKAGNALTYFTPGKDEGESGMRWGLLAVDVSDAGDRILVELEAPGLDKDDIDIDVQGRRLLVTGRKSYQAERRQGSLHISERAFGHFQRVIPLPAEVAVDKAEARYRHGVLSISLPKAAPPGSRRIQVKAG